MPSKKDNVYQHADFILDNMIEISGFSQNQFAENILGIKGGNVSGARKSSKIPDRWFEIMQEKFGVTKEALCKPPEDSCKPPQPVGEVEFARMEQTGRGKDEQLFHQGLDSFFATVKQWQTEENKADAVTCTQFIQKFHERFPEMTEWLKKRDGDCDLGGLQEPARNSGNGGR
jgi:hypothetical protein